MLNNLASERALLAGLIQHGQEAYLDCVDILRPEIFTDTKNSMIYLTLKELLDKGKVDLDKPSIYSCATSLAYSSHICDKPEDKDYITALFNYSISSSNTRDQAAILYKLFVARSLQESSQKTYKQLSEIKGIEGLDSIISIPEKNLSSTINALSYEDDLEVIGNYVDDFLEHLESGNGASIGIPTQYPIFNSVIGDGLRPGVHLVAGRLKVGKSTVGKEIALHCAINNLPVLMIDTEMSWDEQLVRMLSRLAQIDSRIIEKGLYKHNPVDAKKVNIAKQKIKGLNLIHKNVSGKDFNDILSIIKRWLHKTVGINSDGKANPHVIIYDYFKMMNQNVLKDMKEYEAMGYQIAALHDMCKMYSSPVLSFVQINRDGMTKDATDVISQSDRLGWNCISLSIFRRKTTEEIAQDGHQNGNVKLVPLEGRFMSRMDEGDYINMQLDYPTSTLIELGTKFGKVKEFEVK